MKHEVEPNEVGEARLMFDRLLERMGSRGIELKLFCIPYDGRTGRMLLHQGSFVVFSSLAQGNHYLSLSKWTAGIPIQWKEAEALHLSKVFQEFGASGNQTFTINPCAMCGGFLSYPVESVQDPATALGIWISDSASRFVKIAPVLQEANSFLENPISSRRIEILEKIEWLLKHIDPSMPDLLMAKAGLMKVLT
ncbi:MAG: hypothetical protein KGP28_07910 [Bdellovibrionales bacterium]|nr:hypothetical protein [Bdellovibrionales bacterium]